MLNTVDLNHTLDKKTFNKNIRELKNELHSLQLQIKEYKIPVIIIFEGWSSSGKGTMINRVLEPLDPRFFKVYTMNRIHEDAVMRPYLWSFFTKTPEKGHINLLDKGWLMGLMSGGERFNFNAREKKNLMNDINAFEEQLIDDGHVIIKFFMHISKAEQKKRFMELEGDPSTKWRVDADDWKQNENYEKNVRMYEDLIMSNEPKGSRWEVIAANDNYYASDRVYRIIINKINAEINRRKEAAAEHHVDPASFTTHMVSALNGIDLTKDISESDYYKKLKKYSKVMNELCYSLYKRRKSVVIVFEGWDAAGKGGAIKRLTNSLDPRGYEVIPVPPPTTEELNHHYLWRFWKKMPKDGHIAIFDRSWYGRVMVERVEGFCTEEEWKRAYKEINDMELAIINHGTILMKFWLHIDKDEQLARFTSRQNDQLKQYKITDEDWRNREKWDEYELALSDMINLTDTSYAPWHIIESNSKRYARIEVLKRVVKALTKNLNER